MELETQDSLAVLVLGKPGIGKSTLVNGLIGKEVAIVSPKGFVATSGVTKKVECYSDVKEQIKIEVWDTPGLMDPEIDSNETLRTVRAKCSHVDLVLFCLNMSSSRFYEGGEETTMISMISNILGVEIWKKTLVALVQANMLISRLEYDYEDGEMLQHAFCNVLENWRKLLGNKIPYRKIRIVPVGYFNNPFLFPADHKTWLSNFWKKAYKTLPEIKQPALAALNRKRFVVQDSLIPEDFSDDSNLINCQVIKSSYFTDSSCDQNRSENSESTVPYAREMIRPVPVKRKIIPLAPQSGINTGSGDVSSTPIITPQPGPLESETPTDYSGIPIVMGDLSIEETEHSQCESGMAEVEVQTGQLEFQMGDVSKDEDSQCESEMAGVEVQTGQLELQMGDVSKDEDDTNIQVSTLPFQENKISEKILEMNEASEPTRSEEKHELQTNYCETRKNLTAPSDLPVPECPTHPCTTSSSSQNSATEKLPGQFARSTVFPLNSSYLEWDVTPEISGALRELEVGGPQQDFNREGVTKAAEKRSEAKHVTFQVNININQMKKKPLSEQPIITSRSFFDKIKGTFYKIWKKLF